MSDTINGKISYHMYHSYTRVKSGWKVFCNTQLFVDGERAPRIIATVNDRKLFSYTPWTLHCYEEQLQKNQEEGIICDLEFGPEITISIVGGLRVELNDNESPEV